MMNIIEMEKATLVRFKERLDSFIERTNIIPTDCIVNNRLCEIMEYASGDEITYDTDCKFQLYGIKVHEGYGEQSVYFYKK